MANARLLNTLHALTHPHSHMTLNTGFEWALVGMFTRREALPWSAVLWCPVCTAVALWLWLVKNNTYYGD